MFQSFYNCIPVYQPLAKIQALTNCLPYAQGVIADYAWNIADNEDRHGIAWYQVLDVVLQIKRVLMP